MITLLLLLSSYEILVEMKVRNAPVWVCCMFRYLFNAAFFMAHGKCRVEKVPTDRGCNLHVVFNKFVILSYWSLCWCTDY